MDIVCQNCKASIAADQALTATACAQCGATLPVATITVHDNAAAAIGETQDWKETRPGGKRAPRELPANLPEIPGYQMLGLIAKGGMGMVIKAHHRLLDRLVAIKLPLESEMIDEHARARFLREARSSARLRHPNICPIYDVGEVGGRPYLAMSFIDGQNLRDWCKHEQLPRGRRRSWWASWRKPSPMHTSTMWCTATSSLPT